MRRRLPIILVATALAGCSMPNPQWTASDVGGDPTTTDVTTTSTQGGTSVAETTTTSDVTTEPTTGSTSTTDPTASSTTEPMTTSTTDPTTTSTTTGENLCENWDFNEAGAFELKIDKLPDGDFGFPENPLNCKDEAFLWQGGIEYLPNGERTIIQVTPTNICGGEYPGMPFMQVSGRFPDGFKPGGEVTCFTMLVYLAADDQDGCTKVEGFEIIDLNNAEKLLLGVSGGRLKLSQMPFNDGVQTSAAELCEDVGDCGVETGILKVGHAFHEFTSVGEQQWHEGDTYDFFNARSHNHGSLDPNAACHHHMDWLIRRAL